MDRKRDVVSRKLCLLARGYQLGLDEIVFPSDLEQSRQRLGDLGPAGDKVFATLVDDRVHRRNRRSPGDAEATGLNLNQLSICHVHEAAVIPYRWKIRT